MTNQLVPRRAQTRPREEAEGCERESTGVTHAGGGELSSWEAAGSHQVPALRHSYPESPRWTLWGTTQIPLSREGLMSTPSAEKWQVLQYYLSRERHPNSRLSPLGKTLPPEAPWGIRGWRLSQLDFSSAQSHFLPPLQQQFILGHP